MEAIRPQLNRQISQQSTLSKTSTLTPTVRRLGSAPSLAGLRQFAAQLGVKIPGAQSKPVDDLEKQLSFVPPTIRRPESTYQQAMERPVVADVRVTQSAPLTVAWSNKKAKVVGGAIGVTIGLATGAGLSAITSNPFGLLFSPLPMTPMGMIAYLIIQSLKC